MKGKPTFSRPSEVILLAHGSGGRLSRDLIGELFLEAFDNPALAKLDDAAVLEVGGGRIAFTTDSYVVTPIFFPGGDIGKLAAAGTVNDLVTTGAVPLYLSAGFIIEEGFPLSDLKKIVHSLAETARLAGVSIVTGDTKVVNHGSLDKIFINTAGVGIIPEGLNISGANARPGDVIILSGTIGDHGIAVLSKREGLKFKTTVESDCAPLNGLAAAMLAVSTEIRCLRDPTRGGLASVVNEIAAQSRVGIFIDEKSLPVKEEVRGASELLGLDPLYLANEGKLVAIVAPEAAEAILGALTSHPLGREAAIIGEVRAEPAGRCVLISPLRSTRVIDLPVGELLPRIC